MKLSTINAAIFSILLSILFCSEIQAQSNKFLIGASGGVSLSKFNFSDSGLSSKSKFGYNGGVNFGIEFNRIAILSGVQYMSGGSKYATENMYFDAIEDFAFLSFDEKNNYLSIPLLIRYRLLSEEFGITLTAGPKFNLGLSSKGTQEISTFEGLYEEYLRINGASPVEDYQQTFGSDIDDPYQKLQMSFVLSPGVFFAISEQGRLGVNMVFDFGTSNMLNGRYADALGTSREIKMNSTGLTITYEHTFDFNIGDKY